MNRRLELHEVLCEMLGSRNVYYQPPESVKMNYPAIVYSKDNIAVRHGNNSTYLMRTAYRIVLVDKKPENVCFDRLLTLPLCRFVRHYEADNLNHDVFLLYF